MAAAWCFHLIIGLVVALEYGADDDVAVNPINYDTARVATGLVDDSSPAPPHEPLNHHPLITTGTSSNTGGSRRYKRNTGCATKPASPANGRMQCSAYSGCRAQCNRKFQFPGGERRLFLECDETTGQWKVAGDIWRTLPNCIFVCRPPCQNNGICSAPDVCECPDIWEGPTCEVPKLPKKKECGNKPSTPKNSRIFCSKDECMARCHEEYEFAEGITHLTFECLDGEWIIKNSRWTTTPDCERQKLTISATTTLPTTTPPTTPSTTPPTTITTTPPTTTPPPTTTTPTSTTPTTTPTTRTTPTTAPRTTTITEATTSILSEEGKSLGSGTPGGLNSSDVSPSYRRLIIGSTAAALVTTLLLILLVRFLKKKWMSGSNVVAHPEGNQKDDLEL